MSSIHILFFTATACCRSSVCLMTIHLCLLLLTTSNVLAIDEEQREFIMGMIKELSRKVVRGEEIPADNPLSALLVNVKTEADTEVDHSRCLEHLGTCIEVDHFPGHPVIHFLANGGPFF